MKIKKKRTNFNSEKKSNVQFSKYALPFLTLILIIILTIGYSAMTSELKISGNAAFRVEADIRITGIRVYEASNGGSILYNPNFSRDSIITGITLPNLDSTVTFEVTVTNFSSITMLLEQINNLNMSNNNITYTITEIAIDDTVDGFETITFFVTFHYADNVTTLPDNRNLESRIEFIFVPASSEVVITFMHNGAMSIGATSLTCNIQSPDTSCEIIAPTISRMGHNVIGWNTDPNATTSLWDVGEPRNFSSSQTWYAITELIIVPTPMCDVYLATGNMGGTNPAPWAVCDDGVAIIGGGTVNTGTGNAVQSRFPADVRPLINRIVLTEPLISGPNLYDLFGSLPNLTTIDNMHFLDTTATVRMTRMFANSPSLVQVDLSWMSVPNVQIMYRMFYRTGAQQINLGGNFNPQSATNMGSMFWHSDQVTTVGDISGWNTGNVVRMTRMFQGMTSLQSVNVGPWDVSNVELFYHMFNSTTNLTSVGNLSNWDIGSARRMENMFAGAHSLTTIGNIGNWNSDYIINLNSMFNNAQSITSLNFSSFDTRGLIGNSMNLMLGNMHSLREVTFGPNWHLAGPGSSLNLPNPPSTAGFTGLWVTIDGAHTATSIQLNTNAVGSNIVNTWVWQTTD